jgi:hypothetical protein
VHKEAAVGLQCVSEREGEEEEEEEERTLKLGWNATAVKPASPSFSTLGIVRKFAMYSPVERLKTSSLPGCMEQAMSDASNHNMEKEIALGTQRTGGQCRPSDLGWK